MLKTFALNLATKNNSRSFALLYKRALNTKAQSLPAETSKVNAVKASDLTAQKNTKKVVNPLKHEDFFNVKQLVNLEELFK